MCILFVFLYVLDYNENLCQTPKTLEQIAQLCNEKKLNAKTCSERSTELYLAVLIKVSSKYLAIYNNAYSFNGLTNLSTLASTIAKNIQEKS